MKILIQFEDHEMKAWGHNLTEKYVALQLGNVVMTWSTGRLELVGAGEFSIRGIVLDQAFYATEPNAEQWQKEQKQLPNEQKLLEDKS